MLRRNRLTRIRDILTSMLLAVAICLVWPAMGAAHGFHGDEHHLVEPHADAAVHDHADPVAMPVCSPDQGCCAMAHCHPGVAQPPAAMAHARLYPSPEPSAALEQVGIDPAIPLPPPRAPWLI